MPTITPNTAIEFTPCALGPGSPWDPAFPIPTYIARCIDTGTRAIGYVIASDENTTAICLPDGQSAATLTTAAIGEVTPLPIVEGADAVGHVLRVAKPVDPALQGHRLVIAGVVDPAMRVELWGPEVVAVMLAGMA